MHECRNCELHRGRTNIVMGEGNGSSGLMIIGEGPGGVEDELGRPFVGPAGKLLDKILAAAHLDRKTVYLTNVVKCQPPNNRDPLVAECDACRPILNEEILTIRPQVILCMGRISASQMIHPGFKITKERGQWWTMSDGSMITATFHPAYLLYREGADLSLAKRMVWTDIKSVVAKLGEG